MGQTNLFPWQQDSTLQDYLVINDRVRVRQMLSNLIINAVKFTDTGGIQFELKPLERQADEVVPSSA